MLFRTSTAAPNLIFRACFMFAFVLPLLFAKKNMFPAVMICFMIVGTYGFAFNYMPYQMSIYFIMSLIILLFNQNKSNITYISLIYIATIILVFARNIFDTIIPHNVSLCIATIGIFIIVSRNDINASTLNMLYCFIVSTLSLSILYLFNYDKFLLDYNAAEGLERSGWIDPNYFSAIIGMGIISSIILLLKNNKNILKVILIVTIMIGFVVQVLLASRGALLAVSLSSLVLLFFAEIKKRYKLLFSFIIFVFLLWMYTNNYFDLLEYRINNDTGGGSGRLDIWLAKLNAFSTEGNIFQWLFGMGFQSAFELSGISGRGVGFHNDFLAILCGYGLVGLIIFIYWIFYPLTISTANNRLYVFASLLYLLITYITLEPMSLGYLPFYAFYYLIFLLAQSHNN